MDVTSRARVLVVLLVVSAVTAGLGAARQGGPAVTRASEAPLPAQFAGVWDYNPTESVNIQTGRPEQATGRAPARGTRPPSDNSTATLRDREIDARNAGGTRATPEMMRESQDLTRDLLEVAERLTIAVAGDAVTITDDLDRTRVFATDGRKERFRIGAAQFDARVSWQDGQLRKSIEAAYGFRLTETYFLSPDARRLFVAVRLGEAKPGVKQVGFNRVYDRVESQAP